MLIVAGLQVPVMPLLEVVGNAGTVAFWHSGAMVVNIGISCGLTVMFNVVDVAH